MASCPNKNDPAYKDLVEKLGSETLANAEWYKNEHKPTEIKEVPFTKQRLYYNRIVKRLEREISQLKDGSVKFIEKSKELEFIQAKILETTAGTSQDQIYKELGEFTLNKVEEFIKQLESGAPIDTFKNIQHAWETIGVFMEFKGLRDRSSDLFDRLIPFSNEAMVNEIQEHSTQKVKPSLEDINAQNEDIRTFKRWTGSLSDLPNYIASTIGSIIRRAQNTVETKVKQLGKDIQEEVSLLDDYSKKNGATLEDTYKILIQEHKGTLILAKEYNENGEENKNFTKIKNTPELKRFYEFYQKTIAEAEDGMPIKLGKYFIPNINKKESFVKSAVRSLNPIKTRKVAEGIQEENISDIVQLEYHKPIPADEKSFDLGTSLFQFSKWAANYNEMSEILPKVRVLQEQLKFKMVDGTIQERRFSKPSNPGVTVIGEQSNIYKVVDDIIEMQVKGNMKTDQGNYVIDDFYDENGDRQQKFIDGVGITDIMLRFNSLLRIGFSPIGATVNWLFGDISNLIEGFGGRFFTNKGLVQASNIFFKQNFDKESVLNKLLIRMNFLQELDDYELQESIEKTGKVNKMSPEKLLEYMYSLQKAGEKFLQSRTGLAVMIKDEYLTKDGELTDKYNNASEEEIQQLRDKIQRLNQKIHGRYSQKEAAAAQANVLYRLVAQFRKWIPSAVENRIGIAQWDNRLQAETEGMYLTFGRLVLKNWKSPSQAFENMLLPLVGAKKLLESGKMTETEIYNIRRMSIELITAASLMLLYAALHGGDDDEDKRRRRLPMIKLALTMLDRASGDLTFFYSPKQATHLMKNAIPISKTLGDIGDAITVIPKALYSGDYTVKTGSSKGRNVIAKEFSDVTPLLKPIFDIYRVARKDVDLEEQR